MKFQSINPYTNEIIESFPALSEQEIGQKLESSREAFYPWSKTSFRYRADLLLKVADVLDNDTDRYAKTITLEMGKTINEARGEIKKCAWVCRYYAENAEEFLQDEIISTDARKSYVRYEPIGAVLAIMPWNFPFWQVFRFAAPTLMAGNTGLLKHAPNVSRCALQIEALFTEAGFPEGVFQSLIIDVNHVPKLVAHPIVQAVTLTGSNRAGASVASLAGQHIKKSVLELGGSDPFIVLADADLNHTAKVAVQARMMNAGQSCIAAKRFIVHEKVKDEFTQRVQQHIEALKTGNPLHESTTTGPLARVDLAENIERQINQSVQKGAQLVIGGQREGARFSPALLLNVQPGMAAFDEETFGPAATIIPVESEAKAIERANQTLYGLGASIWTNDPEKGAMLAQDIFSGSVFINSLVKSDPRLPFGGIKQSGYGRELSYHGIKEFVNAKTIYIA
jgi:succinate-semialdehyde dehydrogenase / glutarate-semialdehyde dehydrogenase